MSKKNKGLSDGILEAPNCKLVFDEDFNPSIECATHSDVARAGILISERGILIKEVAVMIDEKVLSKSEKTVKPTLKVKKKTDIKKIKVKK